MTSTTMSPDAPYPWVRAALFVTAVATLLISGVFYVSRYLSDGTDGPVPGGALVSGELRDLSTVNWPDVLGEDGHCADNQCSPDRSLELFLASSGWSRTTGMLVRDGDLYIPCDLGFMWGRFDGQQRYILHAIYLVKRWHLDAERNGAATIRVNDNRYHGKLVKVTDSELQHALERQLEQMAARWIAPDKLGPPPTEGPRDIRFFRLEAQQPNG